MAASRLLSLAAAIEAAIGLALITAPQVVASLLLGAELTAAGVAVARVAGMALLSLGVACWLSRAEASKTAALAAMLTYNVLVTAYLTYLGLGGELVGILLWPVIAIHTVLSILFAYTWSYGERPRQPRLG